MTENTEQILSYLKHHMGGRHRDNRSPGDGSLICRMHYDEPDEIERKVQEASASFEIWRDVPAPKRGEAIRIFGENLRKDKESLAEIITLECGKTITESLGEVQEMIDICDFAVGLSRQLYGLTIVSERTNHAMKETWHPLGPVLVISAFNFPMAVWAWNFALSIVCGNPVIWKPSEKTPLCAGACQFIWNESVKLVHYAPDNLSQIIVGERETGHRLVIDPRIKLVSATGSTEMGREVGNNVASRFGRSLLELGGNNAAIVTPHASFNLAAEAVLFGAVGTTGQRCTTTRRCFIHEEIYSEFVSNLRRGFVNVSKHIGPPEDKDTLIGPLIDAPAYHKMQQAIVDAQNKHCKIHGGDRVLLDKYPNAYYVKPALIESKGPLDIMKSEVFAPILYVVPYGTLSEALQMNNDVPQGLSSCIFTNDIRESEQFLKYSDCGIANINIGTSGAEIGGAFGGEKETGGGRESGSDSWKQYMRRQTSTTYYGRALPELSQGIKFNLD